MFLVLINVGTVPTCGDCFSLTLGHLPMVLTKVLKHVFAGVASENENIDVKGHALQIGPLY